LVIVVDPISSQSPITQLPISVNALVTRQLDLFVLGSRSDAPLNILAPIDTRARPHLEQVLDMRAQARNVQCVKWLVQVAGDLPANDGLEAGAARLVGHALVEDLVGEQVAVGVVWLEPGEVEAVVGDVGEEEVRGWRRSGLEGAR